MKSSVTHPGYVRRTGDVACARRVDGDGPVGSAGDDGMCSMGRPSDGPGCLTIRLIEAPALLERTVVSLMPRCDDPPPAASRAA
jgi:hypothetical protein